MVKLYYLYSVALPSLELYKESPGSLICFMMKKLVSVCFHSADLVASPATSSLHLQPQSTPVSTTSDVPGELLVELHALSHTQHNKQYELSQYFHATHKFGYRNFLHEVSSNGSGRHLRLGAQRLILCACICTHMLGGSGGMLSQENFAN